MKREREWCEQRERGAEVEVIEKELISPRVCRNSESEEVRKGEERTSVCVRNRGVEVIARSFLRVINKETPRKGKCAEE